MDDLKMNELVNEWNNTNKSIPFDEWMYYQGCSAQSEADRIAVNNIENHFSKVGGHTEVVLIKGETVHALSAAQIKEQS